VVTHVLGRRSGGLVHCQKAVTGETGGKQTGTVLTFELLDAGFPSCEAG
jgi:hypothetical protein